MIRNKLKKTAAGFLAALICMASAFPVKDYASAGNRGVVYMSDNVLTLSDGHGLNFKTVYNEDLHSYETAYCIQHGTSLYSMTRVAAEDLNLESFSGTVNDLLRLALAYGYDSSDNNSETLRISSSSGQKYAATQFIVWNIIGGNYDDNFNRNYGWFDYADSDVAYSQQINSYVTEIENNIRAVIAGRNGGIKLFTSAQESASESYPHTDVWDDRTDSEKNSIAENIIGFVTDIYDYMLYGSEGRAYEINSQVNYIFNGSLSAAQLYDAIYNSQEAQEHINGMSDSEYVTMLYRTILNREPDSGGLATHTQALASGKSRKALMQDLMSSQEWALYSSSLDVAGGNVYYVFEYELPAGASLSTSAIVSNSTGEEVNFIRLSGNKWRIVLGATGTVTFEIDMGLTSLPVVWRSQSGNYQKMISVTDSFRDLRYVSFGAKGEISYNPTATPTPKPSNSPTPTPYQVTDRPASISLTKVGRTMTDSHQELCSIINSEGERMDLDLTVFDMNRVNLSGATFVCVPRNDVYRHEGNSSAVSRRKVFSAGQRIIMTEGASGVYNLGGLYEGVYDIYETQAPDGFLPINGIVATVTVTDKVNGYAHTATVSGRNSSNSAVTISSAGKIIVNDTPVKAIIDISKAIPQGNMTDEEYERAISSVVFGLYTAEKNEYFDSKYVASGALVGVSQVKVVRDQDGKIIGGEAVFDNDIPDGKYYVQEIYAGPAIISDGSRYDLQVDRSGATEASINIGLNIENDLKTGKIIVYKYDEWYKTYLEGAEFSVFREDGSLYGLMNWNEEEKYYEIDAGYGNYMIRETLAPDGFILDETVYEAVINDDGECVRITDAGGEGISNSPVTYSLRLYKVDDSDAERQLAGAVFEIYEDSNGSGEYEADEDKNAMTYVDGELLEAQVIETVNSNGEAEYCLSGQLRAGCYFVIETKCPEGYSLTDGSDGITKIVLGERNSSDTDLIMQENNVNVRIGNRCSGSIHITKLDVDYPDSRLSGAVFTVYEDSNGNGLIDADTDKLVGVMTEETSGEYYIHDLPYGHYLIEESQAPENYERREDIWQVFIESDGMTYDISDSDFAGVADRPQTGSLKVIKLSSDNHIAGISFRIMGVDFSGREYDEVFETDDNGIILIEGLRVGSYTVSEVDNEVVAGYDLAEDAVVTIGAGQTCEVYMTNTERQLNTPTPTITPTASVTPSLTPEITPTASITPEDKTITNTGERTSNYEKTGVLLIAIASFLMLSILPFGIRKYKNDRE